VFPLRNALTAVVVIIVAGAGVLVAGATLSQVTVDYNIDGSDPASTATPIGVDCPIGAPCKVQSVFNVADTNQPAGSLTSISPAAFQGIIGTSIDNGTVVGNTHVVVKYAVTGGCSWPKVTIDETGNFLDGAVKGEVPDDGSAAALGDTSKWPTRLESDLRVSQLRASGHPVGRRSVAVLVYQPPIGPEMQIPINLLSFDVSDGNGFGGLTLQGTYNVAVVGDPTSPLTGSLCTPMTSTGLLLGETDTGLTLQTCEEEGLHTMTTVLTRESGGALVFDATVSDTVSCSTSVGGMQELPDVAAAAGGSSSPPYAALAGAAACVVVLAAGGWYARRRRLS
jgi:hypothetical protein